MASEQSRFVHFVPGEARMKSKSEKRVVCQICFESFESNKALRSHIGDFQLEVQQLMIKMIEAQAHLPLRNIRYYATSCDDNNGCDSGCDDDTGSENDEGDDGDDAMNEIFLRTKESQAKLQCPYPTCHRQKQFKEKPQLVRHYQSHVQCYESCIFCRNSFTYVRPFLRHRCSRRVQENNKAKDYYMKERCAQLRRHSSNRLNEMLGLNVKEHERSKKREHNVEGHSEPSRSSKRRLAEVNVEADGWLPTDTLVHLGGSSQMDNQNSMHATSTPSLVIPFGEPTAQSSTLSDAAFSNEATYHFSQTAGRPSNFAHGYAPIFDDITITPCYDLSQLYPNNTVIENEKSEQGMMG